jgi:hypothetical protein
MAEKKKTKAKKKTEPEEPKDAPMPDKEPEGKPLSAYKKFEMKKVDVVHPPDEEYDKQIEDAETKLREMNLKHPVWLKDRHPIDPSWQIMFPSNQTGEQLSIIIQQRAGGSMPLLEAPSFLKRGGVRLLDALLEYAPVAQEEAEAALKAAEAEKEQEGDDSGTGDSSG